MDYHASVPIYGMPPTVSKFEVSLKEGADRSAAAADLRVLFPVLTEKNAGRAVKELPWFVVYEPETWEFLNSPALSNHDPNSQNLCVKQHYVRIGQCFLEKQMYFNYRVQGSESSVREFLKGTFRWLRITSITAFLQDPIFPVPPDPIHEDILRIAGEKGVTLECEISFRLRK